jgi:uncharacterized OsmC-like protein
MSSQDDIRLAIDRGVEAMKQRSTLGRGTAITTARLRSGLAVDVEDGRWRVAADMSEKVGGAGSAPDPGVYGRAALASCLAIGYTMWAARLGVPLNGVEVSVEADYDARGEFGVTDDPPSYSLVRCKVRLDSAAPEADLRSLARVAEERSPYLDLFRRPIPVTTEVEIVSGARS